jgi:hypothetical protein
MRVTTFSAAAIVLFAAGLALLWPGRNAAPGPAVVIAQAPQAAAKQPQDPFGAPGAKAVVPKEADPFAAPPGPAAAAAPATRPATSAQKIEMELERPTQLDVVEMPLKDVVQYLQELHHMPIVLKSKRMEESGISPDVPVTKSLRGVRLRSALNLLLEDCELTYVVKDEVLQITTPQDALAMMEIRIYDCRDILSIPEATTKKEQDDPNRAVEPQPQVTKRAGGYGGTFGGGGWMSERDRRASQLMTIITTNVEPRTWQGGDFTDPNISVHGSVSEYNGLIVVTQTAQVHTKIEHVLDMLREAAGLEPTKARKVVR